MASRKRKAVPTRLSSNRDPEVNGCSEAEETGSGNGLGQPEVGWCHMSSGVMESIWSMIGSAPTVEDKQKRLNAMIHQLQAIRDQLTKQHNQQVSVRSLPTCKVNVNVCSE